MSVNRRKTNGSQNTLHGSTHAVVLLVVSFDVVGCGHEHVCVCVWAVQEIRGMKSLKGPGESMSLPGLEVNPLRKGSLTTSRLASKADFTYHPAGSLCSSDLHNGSHILL